MSQKKTTNKKSTSSISYNSVLQNYKESINRFNGLSKKGKSAEKNLPLNEVARKIEEKFRNSMELFEKISINSDSDIIEKKCDRLELKNSTKKNYSKQFNTLLVEDNLFTESESDSVKEGKNSNLDETKMTTKKDSDNIENIWDFVEKMNKEALDISIDDFACSTESEFDVSDTETDCSPQFRKKKITSDVKSSDDYKSSDICTYICSECSSSNTIIEETTGHVVCKDCGVINEESFDYSPEWKQFNNDDSRGEGMNRCACPTSYFFPKSSQGTIIAGSKSSRLRRKQKWNSYVYKERSLSKVLERIKDVCSKSGIQKIVVDSASIMYKKLSDCKHKTGDNKGKSIIIRGSNREGIIAACVFASCIINEIPVSVKEIANMFNLDDKRVTKGYKQLYKLMKNCDDNVFFDQLDTSTPEHNIKRFCPRIGISKNNTDLAIKIARNCCRLKLVSDHNPRSIAAGCVMCMIDYQGIDIEKKKISEHFKTSQITISKIFNKISTFIPAFVDDAATDYLVKQFNICE